VTLNVAVALQSQAVNFRRSVGGWFMRQLVRVATAMAIAAAGTSAHAAWYEAKSDHFIIDGDVDPQVLGDYAKKLERFDQAVRMARKMPDPSLTDSERLRIYVVRKAADWVDLTGGGGLLGEYMARASGAYAFVAKIEGDRPGDYNSDMILFHEYAHHLMFQNWAAALPTWFTEGFAEFFSTAKINDDGSVTLGSGANQRSIGIYSVHHDFPLSEMLRGSEKQLTGWQEELIYSRGWLLTHYLTFDEARHGQLDKYIAGIQSGESAIDSAQAAFGDLGQLDRELDHYAKQDQIPGVVIHPDPAKLSSVKVAPLPAAEAALMPVRMRSDYGVTPSTAKMVAGDALHRAEPYPNDPFAQTEVAEAEYDAEHYDLAVAAADRALAADPNYVGALIYKGRAAMELAKANHATADWNKIRALFAKANRLDTENAEPLMLYYQSFVEAGERPSDSAVKGLMYALVLAPQDRKLRWMAVRQLMLDGKLDDAKRALGPIVFDPHLAAVDDQPEQVLTALKSGNAAKGVALIDELERKWKHD
jgi:tetratricopeptide (TPR) repeat protein